MKHTLHILLISVLLGSCSGESESQSSKETKLPSDDFKSIFIDVEAEKIRLVSAIEAVEIMQLEDANSALISQVANFNESSEHFIIVDPEQQSVLIYDKQGQFVRASNHMGDGPEEHLGIRDLWLEDESVVIYSSGHKVLKYDHEGNFITSFNMEYPYTNIFPLKNGYVANLDTDDLDDRIVFLDENFKMKSSALPHFARQDFMKMTFNTFEKYKGGAVYRTVMNDTIFLIEGSQARPLIKLDYGENWLWEDLSVLSDPGKAMGLISSSEKVWDLMSHLLGDRYLYLSSNLGFTGQLLSIIDRETGAQLALNISKTENEPYSFTPIKWEGDRLLVSMASYDATEIIGKLEQGQVKYRTGTTLAEVESNENPVLMWVKFKDFN